MQEGIEITYDPSSYDSDAARWPAALREIALRNRLRHRAWRYRLRTERPEVRFVLRHLRRGQTAIDGGAHKGAFTYWMRRKVGAGGRVVAFEPIPHLAEHLRRLKRAFGWSGVTIVEAALPDTEGEMPLYIPKEGYLGTTTLLPAGVDHAGVDHNEVPVQVVTLDDFCSAGDLRPVHFIKCDVEGHELELFRGGQRILREDRPILLFECIRWFHPGGRVEHVFDYLRGLDYEGVFFPAGRTTPLSEFDLRVHQSEDTDPFTDPLWSPNFGFVPRDAGRSRVSGP